MFGVIGKLGASDMAIKFDVQINGIDAMGKAVAESCSRAEHEIAELVKDDTEPFVPASGNAAGLSNRTRVIGNTILYPGPYAKYLYYGKVMVNRETLKGPRHFIDKYGNEQIMFPKGAKLIATDRDLHFNQHFHRQAQSHWFEASKAQNLPKWLSAAKKAVERELK